LSPYNCQKSRKLKRIAQHIALIAPERRFSAGEGSGARYEIHTFSECTYTDIAVAVVIEPFGIILKG
jgi:hypothetical protein